MQQIVESMMQLSICYLMFTHSQKFIPALLNAKKLWKEWKW